MFTELIRLGLLERGPSLSEQYVVNEAIIHNKNTRVKIDRYLLPSKPEWPTGVVMCCKAGTELERRRLADGIFAQIHDKHKNALLGQMPTGYPQLLN